VHLHWFPSRSRHEHVVPEAFCIGPASAFDRKNSRRFDDVSWVETRRVPDRRPTHEDDCKNRSSARHKRTLRRQRGSRHQCPPSGRFMMWNDTVVGPHHASKSVVVECPRNNPFRFSIWTSVFRVWPSQRSPENNARPRAPF
jgi:hypothetical protein